MCLRVVLPNLPSSTPLIHMYANTRGPPHPRDAAKAAQKAEAGGDVEGQVQL